MKPAAALLLCILLACSVPCASAAATVDPAFPPASLHRAESAPDFAAWVYERLSAAPPNLSGAQWENRSSAEGPFGHTFHYDLLGSGSNYFDYSSSGHFIGGWLDLESSIRPTDSSEPALRTAALDVAQRLGIPMEGLGVVAHVQDHPYATLDGGFPWGAGIEAQGLFLRFDGPNSTLDRLVFSAWYNANGTPTVASDAAVATALAAAHERGTGERLRVAAVGGSVVSGTKPAWAVTIVEGNCSTEQSYYFVDAESGAYLGREGGIIADGVCAPTFLSIPILGWVVALVAVAAAAAIMARRWRSKGDQGP